ncbi:uncharacterized protein [Oscarella lobularis]|uniref:uncharacterized protein isoform X2 n=1 Tax=Oscarella lobularis TaxID=121494 RepID=UPI0033141C49
MQRVSNSFSTEKDEFLAAVVKGNTNTVLQFIRGYPGKWKEATDIRGETALHLSPTVEITEFLLSAGAHVEALDKLGLTPFLCAVFNGTLAVMNVLISWGCDVSAKTNAGNGALALASSNGHLDIARKLVEMGFSANERHQVGYTSLHWASQQGHARICYFLISSGANIEALEEFEYTPFLCAAYNGNSEVLKILFRRGCNVFAKNSDGCGALALASRSGHLCIARELVDMGCRINEPDKSDYTALHWACAEGHAETVEYLVSAGADTNAKNAFGRTPLLEADFKKQYDVVAALVRILDSQISVQNSREEDNQSEVSETTFQESYVMPEEDKNSFESNCRKSDEDTDEIFQKIYDEALKRGSVAVNRSRVIITGQDGAGKSCLVDSLLSRPFAKDKASTEGAAVDMVHTTTSDWVATDSKDHLDPLIAEGVYRMNQQQLSSECWQEGSSKLSPFVIDSESDIDKSEPALDSVVPVERVETLAENLQKVAMEAKTLTTNQQQLANTFVINRPSEEELSKQILGVRDIWDLGGQEIYLATHSALMPQSREFGLSIYMVVLDISKSLSDNAQSFHRPLDGEIIDQTNDLGWIRTNGDFPLYWFGSITAAHEELPIGTHWLGKDEEVAHPPVFVIGSHRDILESDKKKFSDSASVERWLREQGNRLEKILSESDFMKHIVLPENSIGKELSEMVHFVDKIFLVDNSASGSTSPCEGVTEVRERVDRMTTKFWKGMKKQPLFWVYLEILLFRWSDVMKTVVAKVDEIAKLAQNPNICNITSRDEVFVALKFLANVGAILYYPEVDGLKDVVFTRPMWVIKALSVFVTAAKPGPYMMPKWKKLREKGIMVDDLMNYRLTQIRENDSSEIASVLRNAKQEQIELDNRQIVQLLELLDVITPVEGSTPKEFYVPSMLQTLFLSNSETLWETHPRSSCFPAPLIVIPMKLKFVPECLYFRLVTRFLNLYPKGPQLSRHQCIFQVEDIESPVEVDVELLYHSRGNWISLTIKYFNEEDVEKASRSFLPSIREKLSKEMRSICRQGMAGFEYGVCCQIQSTVNKEGHLDIDVKGLPVLQKEKFEYSPKDAKLYSKFFKRLSAKPEDFLRINCWFSNQICVAKPSPCQGDIPDQISKSFIRIVATLVEDKWQKFAVYLGRKARSIPQYREKSDENLVRAMMVIEDWVEECGREATVNALIQACNECGIHTDSIKAALKRFGRNCLSTD